MATIGDRIRIKRKELGLTQAELGEKLHVTDRAVSKWESGEGDPSISLLSLLAETLNVSVDFLLTGKVEETISLDDMDEEKRALYFIKKDDGVFKKSKWIWISNELNKDEYGEFFTSFYCESSNAECRISCDGDYTLFVNGNMVESNQYGDFEHYKVFDEIDISKYIKRGENTFAVLVWHFGVLYLG